MKALFFIAALGVGFVVNATELVIWNSGVIVLHDGSIFPGEVAFQVSEIVLFRAGEVVTVYPAHKVHSFRFYDPHENINRKFVSILDQPNIRAAFYEIVVSGEVSVLRRLKSKLVSKQKVSDKDDYDYFVHFQDNLISLLHFRSKVYPNLISTSDQMLSLIKTRNLNPNAKSDAIQIVQLYNSLSYKETLLAGI